MRKNLAATAFISVFLALFLVLIGANGTIALSEELDGVEQGGLAPLSGEEDNAGSEDGADLPITIYDGPHRYSSDSFIVADSNGTEHAYYPIVEDFSQQGASIVLVGNTITEGGLPRYVRFEDGKFGPEIPYFDSGYGAEFFIDVQEGLTISDLVLFYGEGTHDPVPNGTTATGSDGTERTVYEVESASTRITVSARVESIEAESVVSGVWGTCPWEITSDGALTVHPGVGASQKGMSSSPWAEYADSITSVVFAEEDGQKVVAPSNCSRLFQSLNTASIDLRGLDTLNLKNMSYMFFRCSLLTSLDFSGYSVSKVSDMSSAFANCSSLTSIDLSGWDTSKTTDMSNMFYECASLISLDLSGWDTSLVTDMSYMFFNCSSVPFLDLSSWNTSCVKSMKNMFRGCSDLRTIRVNSGWSTDNIDSSSSTNMFLGCLSLVGGNGTPYDSRITDVTYACIDTVGRPGYLTSDFVVSGVWGTCPWEISTDGVLTVHPGIGVPPFSVNNRNYSPWGPYSDNITSVVFVAENGRKVIAPSDSSCLFRELSKLEAIDCGGLDTSNVTNMEDLFLGCHALVTLDLSGWDTWNVTSTAHMFSGCDNLKSLDLSGWDTSHVETMSCMFSGCTALSSLILSDWDVSNVSEMHLMFSDCSSLESLDLSGWDVSCVKDLSAMFFSCSSLKSLNLSGWDSSYSLDMSSMFMDCSSLASLDLSGWDTTSVTALTQTFSGCSSLESLDLSSWDTSSLTTLNHVFEGCSSLKALDLSRWDTSSVYEMDSLFSGCRSLASLDLSNWDTSYTTRSKSMYLDCSSLSSWTIGAGYVFKSSDMVPRATSENGKWWSETESKWYSSSAIYGKRSGIADTYLNEGEPELIDISDGFISPVSEQVYTGHPIEPEITVTADGSVLVNGVDYVATYSNNTAEGIATITVNGLGKYVGELSANFTIVSPDSVIASGTWGTCPWEITADRTLTVHPGTGASQEGMVESPWVEYANSIAAVDFAVEGGAKVVAPADSSRLFRSLRAIVSIDCNDLDTSAVTNMEFMFHDCSSLASLDLSSWDTSSVTNMGCMFEGCSSLTSLNVSNWDTSAATHMHHMFQDCLSIASLDLSGWDTLDVTNMNEMFRFCPSLVTITVGDLWSTANIAYGVEMFRDCESLVGGNGTAYDPAYTGYEYARVDADGVPGYLTYKAPSTPTDISMATISAIPAQTYDGAAKEPAVTVALDGRTLTENDYDVEYENNVNAGTATVTVTGKNSYTGAKGASFTISPADLSKATVSAIPAQTYDGGAKAPTITVALDGKTLVAGTDYTVGYKNNVDASPSAATVTVTGKGNYAGSGMSVPFAIMPASIASASIPAIPDQPYGSFEPSVSVTMNEVALSMGADYILSYTNNAKPGRASVAVVSGKGNYTGVREVPFRVRFRDVTDPSSWIYAPVYSASELGIVNGYASGNFGPHDNVTRAQLATMLWNMAGRPAAGSGGRAFSDVAPSNQYYTPIRWAASVGVVNGYPDGTFGPDRPVTRQELAAMLSNYARKVCGIPAIGSPSSYASMRDASSVASWAGPAVGWCYEQRIMSGTSDGRIMPAGNASRCQTAAMLVALYRIIQG